MDVEKQLDSHLKNLLQAKTLEEKYLHWERLKSTHYQRTPAQILEMEIKQGLR